MKFSITMKSADCVYDAVEEAAFARADDDIAHGICDPDRNNMIKHNKNAIFEDIEKWVDSREYITIDFDTLKETAVVRENL